MKMENKYKAIISVDFDGVVVEANYPNIGNLREGAVEYIYKLYKEGYGIVINTCRAGLMEADAINFLNRNKIPYHYVNCNFPHLIEFYRSDSRKISADVYIDDKCLFEIPDWKTKYEIITKRFESNNNNNT